MLVFIIVNQVLSGLNFLAIAVYERPLGFMGKLIGSHLDLEILVAGTGTGSRWGGVVAKGCNALQLVAHRRLDPTRTGACACIHARLVFFSASVSPGHHTDVVVDKGPVPFDLICPP